MYDFEANKVIVRQIGKLISFFKKRQCSYMFLIVKPECEEEQPNLLWDSQRAKREGARADRKGSRR